MRSSLRPLVGIMFLLALPLVAQAQGLRYALVIGNGNYADLGKLKNPANDAQDMSEALKALGFKVKLLVDADLPTMEDAVLRLGNDLSQAADSVGFFFYAGHGVQSGGTNFLIPADAHIIAESYLKTKALPAQSVMDSLQGSRNALNVVVLDACRDNPFSWSRSGTRGLGLVGSQPPGSIVVYSTSSGSVAQDGAGRNSVFTTELLKQLAVPGLEVKELFSRTGKAVSSETAGKQVPAVYSQFFDSAYLSQARVAAAAVPAASAPAAPPAQAPEPPRQAAPGPTLIVAFSHGNISLSTVSAGTIYLDGKPVGSLAERGKARIEAVDAGDRSLQMVYLNGWVECSSAFVDEGQTANLAFSYRKGVSPAATGKAASDDAIKIDFSRGLVDLVQEQPRSLGVFQSSLYGEPSNNPPSKAIDGDPNTLSHTNIRDYNPSWLVVFARSVYIENIVIVNRKAVPGRLRDISVIVYDDAGKAVYTSAVLNPKDEGYAYPDGPPQLVVDLKGKKIVGKTVEVRKTTDPKDPALSLIAKDNGYEVLSLGEVQVFGIPSN